MLVPRYWSEASRAEKVAGGRTVTVRRFGWSSVSQDEAQVHARARVEEALTVLHAGGEKALRTFALRERRVTYGGDQGLPIREEIVGEYPAIDAVVTRNAYGALCLNVRDAMFVDVDWPASSASGFGCVGALLGAPVGGALGALVLETNVWLSALVGLVVLSIAFNVITRLVESCTPRIRDPLAWTRARCTSWCDARPTWRVAVYETPGGARLLPLHAPFRLEGSPDEAIAFMRYVGVDPLYLRMCRLQKCFRARVSPKPWRIGVSEHFRAGGTWPVTDPEKLARRARWVDDYTRAAAGAASCRFVEAVGRGRPDPTIDEVRRIHDDLCRATSSLTLA
jgi:hypothetical protein